MRLSTFCFLLSILTLAGTTSVPAPAAAATRLAPADEYFGRLKMSILGIRNQLAALEIKAGFRGENRSALLGQATFIEDAMREWSAKYPGDPWIPKFRHRLSVVYVRIAALR
ncbi:MAG: hypothetical protein M3N19_02665 [Candidatus Eremiobacteraeota bacterium]|nr:hypothetical protein [Candidatus Eremiobacteraeota bacterium]